MPTESAGNTGNSFMILFSPQMIKNNLSMEREGCLTERKPTPSETEYPLPGQLWARRGPAQGDEMRALPGPLPRAGLRWCWPEAKHLLSHL